MEVHQTHADNEGEVGLLSGSWRELAALLWVPLCLFTPIASHLAHSDAEKEKPPAEADSQVRSSEDADQGEPAVSVFKIGAGDVLDIFVWKEPEVSRSVPVRPDGKISLPLVNDVRASGRTAMELKDILTEKLRQFISQPTVTVTVTQVNSQKITIIGEVTSAGPLPLAGPTRVMDVLASAGFTPFAKKSKISVLRIEQGKQRRFLFNYKDYLKGKNLKQNILLKNGDTIVVP